MVLCVECCKQKYDIISLGNNIVFYFLWLYFEQESVNLEGN